MTHPQTRATVPNEVQPTTQRTPAPPWADALRTPSTVPISPHGGWNFSGVCRG